MVYYCIVTYIELYMSQNVSLGGTTDIFVAIFGCGCHMQDMQDFSRNGWVSEWTSVGVHVLESVIVETYAFSDGGEGGIVQQSLTVLLCSVTAIE